MTDGIRGPWSGNGRNPRWHGRDPELEIRALRSALHTAVGGVRRVLRDMPPEWRTSVAYSRVLYRLGRHGVVIDLRDELLDVPLELPLSPSPDDTWASRTVLHNVARDVAMDEGLWSLLGGGSAGSVTKLDEVIAEAGALGTEAVWRTRVAEPLVQLDELWKSATRAVLGRDPAAIEMLWRLDALLPGASGPNRVTEPPVAFLGALHTRIIEGDIAWEAVERPVTRPQLPPRPTVPPKPSVPPNPWLAVAEASPGAAHRAVVWFWEWARGLCLRLHACVVSGLVPIAASIYWEAVARALAVLAPGAPKDAETVEPAPSVDEFAEPAESEAHASQPKTPAVPTSGPSTPGLPTARPSAGPALVRPVPPTAPEETPAAPPSPTAPVAPAKPANTPAGPAPSLPSPSPVKVHAPARTAVSLALPDPEAVEAVEADIRQVLDTIARTLRPISAAPERRRRPASE